MQRKLLTNGNAFKRTDDRWGGVVWYLNESGERKRKSFSGTTKAEVKKKMTDYITNFENELIESDESRKLLKDGLKNWLEVFKFPAVERTTYDRCETIAKNQIYSFIGDKVISNITAAIVRELLNKLMTDGYSYSTVKQTYNLLNEYFRYLEHEELINKNPMPNVEMIKKANFLSSQGKKSSDVRGRYNLYVGRN